MYWLIYVFIVYKIGLEFCSTQVSKVLSNPGKVHFEGLLHLLMYIRDNKTLSLKYYANINDALVSELLIQASIKTENLLIDFSDYSWQYCSNTGRSTGAYIIFYRGGTIYHGTHVSGPVDKSSAESEYNTSCTI